RERVLLPRRCSFLMPAPDTLLPFLEEAGFGHAIQLRDIAGCVPLILSWIYHRFPEFSSQPADQITWPLAERY
ncbi:hypothetical protein PIB30_111724, partial [Stylosanthes scabra]|nr:hypothetical protein [Stylosanthes scabra]